MSAYRPLDPAGRGTGSSQPGRPTFGPGRDTFQPPAELPSGYLAKGYFDEKGNCWPQVIQDWPRQISHSLDQSRPQMKTAQLRGRFFTEVRRLETKLKAGRNFDAIRPELLKIGAFAEQAVNKKKVPLLFKQFIDANLRLATKGEKEFTDGFVNHFECVVAYFPERK